MKAIEFQAEVGPDRKLAIPQSVEQQIPSGQMLRVLVLIPETGEEQTWEQMAATDFGLGYADSDAIYDELSDR
jgi:hypothetical protein